METFTKEFFESTKAPQELKDATIQAATAFQRVRKAMSQVELWKKEHALSEKEFAAASERQKDLLIRWNPDTGEVSPKPEEFKQ